MTMRVRVVLEGGGMCGVYQIGVLQELKSMERDGLVNIDAISGASIGSYLAFCYFNDSLESALETLNAATCSFKEESQNTSTFHDRIRGEILECDDKVFQNIKSGCIYSSRIDVATVSNTIDHEYNTREELFDAIACSSHVPYVTGDSWSRLSTNGRKYIDGVFPHIFRDRTNCEYAILYVCNGSFSRPVSILSSRLGETTRVDLGAQDARRFFITRKSTRYCSFVHNWTQPDFIVLRMKQIFAWVVRTLLFVLTSIVYGVVAPIRLIISVVMDDIFLHLMFGDMDHCSFLHDVGYAALTGCAIASSTFIDMFNEILANRHQQDLP